LDVVQRRFSRTCRAARASSQLCETRVGSVAPVQRGARVAKQVLSESSLASQTGDCCGGNPASEGKRWTFNIRNQHCVSGTETGRTGRQVQRAGGAWASGGGSRRRRWHRRRRLSAVRVETRNTQPPPLTKTRPSRRAQRHAGGGGISGAPHGADPQRGGGGKGGTGQGRGARPSHCYRGILQGRPQHQLDQLARYVLACLHMPVFGVWKAATRKQTLAACGVATLCCSPPPPFCQSRTHLSESCDRRVGGC
jgi:hypothetical protein